MKGHEDRLVTAQRKVENLPSGSTSFSIVRAMLALSDIELAQSLVSSATASVVPTPNVITEPEEPMSRVWPSLVSEVYGLRSRNYF